jgi:hypothetical protein
MTPPSPTGHSDLGFHRETPPEWDRKVAMLLGNASKEGNDARKRRHRQL